ncbi:MAG: hypothetical protein ABGZ23_26265 [Fuerstiella sp.]
MSRRTWDDARLLFFTSAAVPAIGTVYSWSRRYWLVGETKLQLKRVLRGHKSA